MNCHLNLSKTFLNISASLHKFHKIASDELGCCFFGFFSLRKYFHGKKIIYFCRKINCLVLPPDIYSLEDIKLFRGPFISCSQLFIVLQGYPDL